MNLFRFSSAFREARELRFSGGGGGEPRGTSPDMNFKKEDLGFKDKLAEQQRQGEAAAETPEQRAEKLVGACNGSLQKHQELLKTFEPAVQDQMKAAMIRFFETTVGNFDRNGVAGLNAQEFEQYQNSAKAKIEEQLKKVQENKDKAKEGVQDSQQRQEQLREQEEKKKMKYEDLNRRLKEQVLEVQAVNPLTIEKPGADATPEQIEQYINTVKTNFAEYQTNVGKLQELQGKLSTQAADIMLLHEKGKDEMKLMSDAMNAGGAAAAAAAGAAVGVWFFGVGALVGAAIGAAIYGVGAAIANEIARRENEQKAQKMNADIAQLKQKFEGVRTQAEASQQVIAANGRELNGALEPVQANIGTRLARREQNIAEKDAAMQRATQDKERSTQEIATLRAQLNDPAFINRRDPEANRLRAEATSKIAELEAGIRQTDQVLVPGLQSEKTELEGGRAAEQQLQANIATADGEVGEKTLEAELELAQRGGELATAKKQLDTLPPLEPKGFFASLGDGFQGVGDAAKYLLSEGLTPVLDQASTWLKRNIPYAGVALAFPLDVTSGFSKGVGDLVHGLGTMIAHPAQAAEGLSALVGLNPNISAGTAWKEMARALSGASEFEGGNYGKGAGIVLANLLATATGAGAAGRGLSAARIAYRAARVEHSVLGAAVRSSATATRVTGAAFAENVAALPGNLARMGGKVLTAPYSLGRGIVYRARTPRVDRLLAQQQAAVAKASEVTAAIEKLDVPAQLKNMSPEELEAVIRNPAELQRLGINNARTINNVLELRKLVGERAAAEAAASAAAHEAELIADDLGDLPGALRNRDPNALRSVLEQYSTRGRQPQRAYQVVESTPNGDLIAFDATGELTVIPTGEVPAFLRNASEHARANWSGSRRAAGGAERTEYPISVLNNSNNARLVVARNLLSDMTPPLTPMQEAAILRAHRATGLRNKAQILDDAGIPRAQRDKLMRHGVTGNPADFPVAAGGPRAAVEATGGVPRLRPGQRGTITLNDGSRVEATFVRQSARNGDLIFDLGGGRQVRVRNPRAAPEAAPRVRAGNADFAAGTNLPAEGSVGTLAIDGVPTRVRYTGRNPAGEHVFEELLPTGAEGTGRIFTRPPEAFGPRAAAEAAPARPRTRIRTEDFAEGRLPEVGKKGKLKNKDGTTTEVTFEGAGPDGELIFRDAAGNRVQIDWGLGEEGVSFSRSRPLTLEAEPAARVRYSLDDLGGGRIPTGTRLRINIRGERQNLTYQGTADGVHTFLDEAGNTVTHAHSEFVAVGGPRAPRAPRAAARAPRAPRAPEPPLGDLNLAELPTITFEGVRGHILSINGNRISFLVSDGGRMRVVTRTLTPDAAARFQAQVGEKLAAAKVPDRVRVGRNPDGDVFAVRQADGTFGFETVPFRRSGWERVPGTRASRRFTRERQRDAYRRAHNEVWNTPFEDTGKTLRQQYGDDLAKIEEELTARVEALNAEAQRLRAADHPSVADAAAANGRAAELESMAGTHTRTLEQVRTARRMQERLPRREPASAAADDAAAAGETGEAAAAAGEGAEAGAVTTPGRGRRALNYVLSRPGALINRVRGRGRPAPAEPAPSTPPPPVEGAAATRGRLGRLYDGARARLTPRGRAEARLARYEREAATLHTELNAQGVTGTAAEMQMQLLGRKFAKETRVNELKGKATLSDAERGELTRLTEEIAQDTRLQQRAGRLAYLEQEIGRLRTPESVPTPGAVPPPETTPGPTGTPPLPSAAPAGVPPSAPRRGPVGRAYDAVTGRIGSLFRRGPREVPLKPAPKFTFTEGGPNPKAAFAEAKAKFLDEPFAGNRRLREFDAAGDLEFIGKQMQGVVDELNLTISAKATTTSPSALAEIARAEAQLPIFTETLAQVKSARVTELKVNPPEPVVPPVAGRSAPSRPGRAAPVDPGDLMPMDRVPPKPAPAPSRPAPIDAGDLMPMDRVHAGAPAKPVVAPPAAPTVFPKVRPNVMVDPIPNPVAAVDEWVAAGLSLDDIARGLSQRVNRRKLTMQKNGVTAAGTRSLERSEAALAEVEARIAARGPAAPAVTPAAKPAARPAAKPSARPAPKPAPAEALPPNVTTALASARDLTKVPAGTTLAPELEAALARTMGGKRTVRYTAHYFPDEFKLGSKRAEPGYNVVTNTGEHLGSGLPRSSNTQLNTTLEGIRAHQPSMMETVYLQNSKRGTSTLTYEIGGLNSFDSVGRFGGRSSVAFELPAEEAASIMRILKQDPAQARLFFFTLMHEVPQSGIIFKSNRMPRFGDVTAGEFYFGECTKGVSDYSISAMRQGPGGWQNLPLTRVKRGDYAGTYRTPEDVAIRGSDR